MTTLDVIDDVIHHIASFLCVSKEIKEDMRAFYRMRGVCHQFQRVIDTSLTFWQIMLSHTRRASIQPPPLMPVSLDAIRAFVPLDYREFTLREKFKIYSSAYHFGYRPRHEHNELDYTKVVLPRFRRDLYSLKGEKCYMDRLKKYTRIVKKMNRLCDIKRKRKDVIRKSPKVIEFLS